jgi:dipeptidyl aminopeptidase/acylaminoacyl peptidase
MSTASPDGRWIAFARNHPTIDGPDQSIWLCAVDGQPVQLRRLGADTEEISAIIWSADSRRVAFLTNDAILGVYEPATLTLVASGYVRYPNANYPPKFMVRDLAFTDDGHAVSYVPCERTYLPVSGSERWTEQISCSPGREALAIADLAARQARLHPDRPF